MRLIADFDQTDPYFNLAAEEYLLLNTNDNVCRFWKNEPTVVIGKHQVLAAEINTKVAFEKEVKMARRISGGGTVYHDLGNINFTFIQKNIGGNKIDFKQFTQPIVDALAMLGLKVNHSGRNDLMLEGFKISGNAAHLSQKLNKTLHHGTLLFNSNLDNLGAILKTEIAQFGGKFVQSNRSKVCNIVDYLKNITIEDFQAHLCNTFIDNGYSPANFTAAEKEQIIKLSNQKYRGIDWIAGYSPKYCVHGSFNQIPLMINVIGGKITEINMPHPLENELRSKLVNHYHTYEILSREIKNLEIDSQDCKKLIKSFFGSLV